MIYKIAYCAFLLIHIGKVIKDDEYSENWSNFISYGIGVSEAYDLKSGNKLLRERVQELEARPLTIELTREEPEGAAWQSVGECTITYYCGCIDLYIDSHDQVLQIGTYQTSVSYSNNIKVKGEEKEMNETKFYEDIVKSKKPVKIVFVTGFQLIAKIKEFSDTALIAEGISGKHLIYKQAISTVTVSE